MYGHTSLTALLIFTNFVKDENKYKENLTLNQFQKTVFCNWMLDYQGRNFYYDN